MAIISHLTKNPVYGHFDSMNTIRHSDFLGAFYFRSNPYCHVHGEISMMNIGHDHPKNGYFGGKAC